MPVRVKKRGPANNLFVRDLNYIIENAEVPPFKDLFFTIRYKKEFEEHYIEELQLGLRARNILEHNKIETIGQLLDNWNFLMSFKSSGIITVKEIKNQLLDFYYKSLNDNERILFWKEAFAHAR